MNLSIKYSDKVGVASNIICMLHCFATPSRNSNKKIINYFFIAVSGIAVYFSAKNSTNNIVKFFMVLTWLILSFLIFSEGLEILHLPEILTYLSASFLSLLHIYNHKYCTCIN